MEPEQSRKMEALYGAALQVEPAGRAAFVAQRCAGDESLRRAAESPPLHDENAGRFLCATPGATRSIRRSNSAAGHLVLGAPA
jgi:hypothetical protein